ncbi:MAG: PD-(D/E)XK nuclease family protein [Burkholderiales bacterium]
MPHAPVARQELFARLAEGHAARVTVVTPNLRLSRELAREFDAMQAAKGLPVWETADILPFGAFVERLYEDALYSDLAAKLPLLLTAAQEEALWEAQIRASRWGEALLSTASAARGAARAWALAQAWRIAGALGKFPGNEDAEAFAEWARGHAKRCADENLADGATLPDAVAPLLVLDALRKPKLLVAYAFDAIAPQQRDFLDACAKAGIELMTCGPDRTVGQRPTLRAFPSAKEELDAAARWARARLEGGASRIGVVVPQLGLRRKEVVRVFARTLDPGHNLPGAPRRALPFNVSLGAPLAEYPLVHAALSLLELASQDIDFEQASRLIRSPYIAGASSEMARRSLLDASLRRVAPAKLGLGKLISLIQRAPALRQTLEKLYSVERPTANSPHDWARHFTDLLAAAGFPGRELDSEEYQAQAKWNATLAEFAKLERVQPRLSQRQALARLRGCAEVLFQPETPDAPIQVLGILESLGLEFDGLWVSGLTDDEWPLRARPDPFLPPALQRKAGIPEASAEATLARCRRITQEWSAAAGEVIFSWPAHEEDRSLIGTPLVSGISPTAGEIPEIYEKPRYRDEIFARRGTEASVDDHAPVLATRSPKGGTRILSDQSACPFRAFAHHRLDSKELEEPAEGLDARARGLLLHTLMKALWEELKGSAGLEGDVEPAIAKAAKRAVAEAELGAPMAVLEERRLAKLAREWLVVERARDPFTVVAAEERRELAVAGLVLSGRIDRLDRLESGGHALIDYKTGNPTPNQWLGERPEDPQLPLYAVNAPEPVSVVAFAKLKTGGMRYMGFSRAKDAIPKVKQAENWETLVAGWKAELETLGAGFAGGDARVDPKKGLATCRYCDLQTLCRVHERLSALADEGEEGDG